jgi:AcrR family transcriptional regulator
MPRLAKAARTARHSRVIDVATLQFNWAGVAGASLEEIARRAGLSRAGLYDHCADRQDLVYQCYLRACALVQADLDHAQRSTGNGLNRLTDFVQKSADLDHSPTAVLNELAFLNKAQQAAVRKARARNVQVLSALIKEGQRDGSLRACDLDIVCHAIFGILSWAPLSRVWTGHPDVAFALRMASALPTIVLDGVVAHGVSLPGSHVRISDVKRAPDTSPRAQRWEALACTGSALFNRRGIEGVTLHDIVRELGATKGTLYHYFKGKPAFVEFCYERAFDIYDAIIDLAEAGSTGLERTMRAVELNVEAQLTELHPLRLTTGFGTFPIEIQRKFALRANRLASRCIEFARAGVQDGTLRPLDLEPVRIATPGALTYLTTWLPGGDGKYPGRVAQEVSRLVLLGLRPRK